MRYSRRLQLCFGSLILFLSVECSPSFGTSSTNTTGTNPGSARLLALSERPFHELSVAERKLLEAAADGTDADCAAPSERDRVIRAELLAWLCIDPDVSKLVTSRGISISRATITGKLDLKRASISFPLQIADSVFENSANLENTHLVFLNLRGTHVPGLSLAGSDVELSVYLNNGFESKGEANLVGIKTGGDLNCSGSRFVSIGDQSALSVNRADIKGNVFLDEGFVALGEVDLEGATIGSDLDCDGGQFLGAGNQSALSAIRTNIKGAVLLDQAFMARGEVNLEGATIGSDLDCNGGQFVGTGDQSALSANRANIKGDVFLNQGFVAQGEVDIEDASIGSNLECDGGHFAGAGDQPALSASGAEITGEVFLDEGFVAKGAVNFILTTIGLNLNCTRGQFAATGDQPALCASRANIKYRVFLDQGFTARGGVNLQGATIGSDLECDGGQFVGGTNSPAFDGQGARIDGSVHIRSNISIEGDVTFAFATIARDIRWTCIRDVRIDLQHGKAGSILMDLANSPKTGSVNIDGLVYDQIDELSSANSDNPLRWIGLQSHYKFLPQRFEQLYSVLRKMGFQEDATKVMITKNQEAGDFTLADASDATGRDLSKRRYLKVLADFFTGIWYFFWYKAFGNFIGYGYTPWHALYASLVIVVIGYFVFKAGYATHIIIPKDDGASRRQLEETYPKFNACIYSLETFVPLVKLGVGDYWIPNAHGGAAIRVGKKGLLKFGSLLRCYFWFHIIAGWVLTTLWVGSFTGLIKS